VQDARQIGGARDLDRPLHDGRSDGHERRVEQRLEQAVPLLLLACGQDYR
jgi:hypothetical protein